MKRFIYEVILFILIFWTIVELAVHWQAFIPISVLSIFGVLYYNKYIKSNEQKYEI